MSQSRKVFQEFGSLNVLETLILTNNKITTDTSSNLYVNGNLCGNNGGSGVSTQVIFPQPTLDCLMEFGNLYSAIPFYSDSIGNTISNSDLYYSTFGENTPNLITTIDQGAILWFYTDASYGNTGNFELSLITNAYNYQNGIQIETQNFSYGTLAITSDYITIQNDNSDNGTISINSNDITISTDNSNSIVVNTSGTTISGNVSIGNLYSQNQTTTYLKPTYLIPNIDFLQQDTTGNITTAVQTNNTQFGYITTNECTITKGSVSFNVENFSTYPGTPIIVTLANYTGTQGLPTVYSTQSGTGFNIVIQNNDSDFALNGSLGIMYTIMNIQATF